MICLGKKSYFLGRKKIAGEPTKSEKKHGKEQCDGIAVCSST
jgi:hypothetical protein